MNLLEERTVEELCRDFGERQTTDGPATRTGPRASRTLVVFHRAVVAYLDQSERVRFAKAMTTAPGHWVGNEGPCVVPGLTATAGHPPPGPAVGAAPFVLGLDGRAEAWTQGHGRAPAWS